MTVPSRTASRSEYPGHPAVLRLAPPSPDQAEGALSPSLRVASVGSLPAFEMKFLVSETVAHEIEQLAMAGLSLDPHGDPALGNGYLTTTLYSDTENLDVFYAQPPFRRRKLRLRRYGNEPWIFLERKYRRGDRVKKRRSAVPDTELVRLASAESDEGWAGQWFHRQLLHRRLRPSCRISYHRVAYLGATKEGAMRLTFDRSVRGCLTDQWTVEPFDGGWPILAGKVVCELKFTNAMPAFFKRIVEQLHLTPMRVSKYRTFMGAVCSQWAKGNLHA